MSESTFESRLWAFQRAFMAVISFVGSQDTTTSKSWKMRKSDSLILSCKLHPSSFIKILVFETNFPQKLKISHFTWFQFISMTLVRRFKKFQISKRVRFWHSVSIYVPTCHCTFWPKTFQVKSRNDELVNIWNRNVKWVLFWKKN